MKLKYKYNITFKYISSDGASYFSTNFIKKNYTEFFIDFTTHNLWKKNIKTLEKKQQITKFINKFEQY